MSLRADLTKLAKEHPELREHLVPLLRQGARMNAKALKEQILADLEDESFETGHTREVAKNYGVSLSMARKVLVELADQKKLTWMDPENQGGDGGARGRSPNHYYWDYPWD
jgi:hypothetical protein